jgi:hypothetical protein
MNDKETGVKVVRRPEGQPKVADLVSNRTLIIQPVAPNRSGPSDSVELIAAGNLAELTAKARPELEFDVEQTAEGGEKQQVRTIMRYGLGHESEVLKDFEVDHLIAGAEAIDAPDAAGQIERRPLLDLRLKSTAINDLMAELRSPNSRLAAALRDPRQRAAVVSALRAELARLEPLAEQKKAARQVHEASVKL